MWTDVDFVAEQMNAAEQDRLEAEWAEDYWAEQDRLAWEDYEANWEGSDTDLVADCEDNLDWEDLHDFEPPF